MKSLFVVALAAALFQTGGKLEIKDVVEGKGEPARAGDILTVHYTGTLTDGKQFDSTVGKEPFQFILGAGQVIAGWDQGMVGMKAGGQRQLVIPSDLAYGDRGAGDDIPPKATLKFDVNMIKIDRIPVKILKKGSGDKVAKAGDSMELQYQVTDDKGKKIDSSYDRKQTFQIILGRTGLIKGFTAGVMGMKQGEKRQFTVPGEFAYGKEGRPPVIAPNATLIFEVELVKLATPAAIK
jgi:FKBP-type peptidyl-prolyl cis-trans isomerase